MKDSVKLLFLNPVEKYTTVFIAAMNHKSANWHEKQLTGNLYL